MVDIDEAEDFSGRVEESSGIKEVSRCFLCGRRMTTLTAYLIGSLEYGGLVVCPEHNLESVKHMTFHMVTLEKWTTIEDFS